MSGFAELSSSVSNLRDEKLTRLVIRQPDDFHVHLRQGELLRRVVAFTERQFARAVVMPNLDVPVTTTARAIEYKEQILLALKGKESFTPLMALYLTDESDSEDIIHGFKSNVLTAAKLYPAHATTNSAQGVTKLEKIFPILAVLEKIGMPLLIHGEVTDPDVDIFDREKKFIERELSSIVKRFPSLKVVLEHITTTDAVQFLESSGANIAATITPHHLMINRNAMFQGGFRPHYYCLPVVKREHHRLALRKAATSGNPKFFLGTDSAPHSISAKECACGCAGIFSAPLALECYVTVFEQEHALEKLEAFTSINGARFYGLALNEGKISLERKTWRVDRNLCDSDFSIVPFLEGELLHWKAANRYLAR